MKREIDRSLGFANAILRRREELVGDAIGN